MGLEGRGTDDHHEVFEGRDRASRDVRWISSRVDLVFGSIPQLRAIVETCAQDGAKDPLVHEFVRAWRKVMELDGFVLR